MLDSMLFLCIITLSFYAQEHLKLIRKEKMEEQEIDAHGEKRVLKAVQKKGLSVSDIILTAILLAAGAVLKFFIGSIINIGGMKPNFIIAMYCMAILLIQPKIWEAAVIGLVAGAVCQFFPGSPYLNFGSELAGAIVMALLIRIPLKIGKFNAGPAVSTFLSTAVSGTLFIIMLFLFLGAAKQTLVAYIPIVLCTAVFNAVIVQILYVPLKLATHRNV
jgi:hypothetical protein